MFSYPNAQIVQTKDKEINNIKCIDVAGVQSSTSQGIWLEFVVCGCVLTLLEKCMVRRVTAVPIVHCYLRCHRVFHGTSVRCEELHYLLYNACAKLSRRFPTCIFVSLSFSLIKSLPQSCGALHFKTYRVNCVSRTPRLVDVLHDVSMQQREL